MTSLRLTLIAAFAVLAGGSLAGEKLPPGDKWPPHSIDRPRPPVVAPQYDGAPVPAPAGATVLFDGKDLAKWAGEKKGAAQTDAAKWKVENGYAQVVPG